MKRTFYGIWALCFFCMLTLCCAAAAGTAEDPYQIYTIEDLQAMHEDMGGVYELCADLHLGGLEWEPVGNEAEGAFTGALNGNGHTITGLTIEGAVKYAGLFGYLEGSVQNLHLRDVSVTGYHYVGGIAGYADGATAENCSVSGTVTGVYKNSAIAAGGIVGYLNDGTVSGCTNSGNVASSSSSWSYSGGIVGYINGGAVVSCTNRGNLTSSGSIPYSGGIVGYMNGGTVSNCTNSVSWTSIGTSGGIVGYAKNGVVTECTNNGNVSSSTAAERSAISGGIVGDMSGGTVEACINSGCIISSNSYRSRTAYSGGIIGYGGNGTICSCMNNGSVASYSSAYSPYSGGVVGRGLGVTLSDCINSGKVTPSGGIARELSGSRANCINYGAATGSSNSHYETYALLETNGDYTTALTAEQMRDASNFSALDFENTWMIDANTNSGFPQLRNMPRHLKLNQCVAVLTPGARETLVATLDGAAARVTYSVDNAEIATVAADGTVAAKAIGICTVTATDADGMRANCMVYVYGAATAISVADASVDSGAAVQLTAAQSPETANEKLRWTSGNTGIATVDADGKVTGKAVGEAIITVTAVNSGTTASCKVTVLGKPVTSISLSSTATVNVGAQYTLKPTVSPAQYAGKLTWSSEDERIVTVDETGVLTGVAPGIAVVAVTSESNCRAICTVTVKAPVTALALNKDTLTLEKGYVEKLVPVPTPANTTDSYSWSSSNTSIATVAADGTVTAKAVGSALITVKASSGVRAYCTVTVKNAPVAVSALKLNQTELMLTKAETAQLTATIVPSSATDKTVVWSSSDDNIAAVNNLGVVKAVAPGVAYIRAEAVNGCYALCTVRVVSASGPSLIVADAKGAAGGSATVAVGVAQNPGIAAYKLTVHYDTALLTPVAIEANSAFGGSFVSNLDDTGRTELNVVWYATENTDLNGTLFTVEFRVAASAANGATGAVSVTSDSKDICDKAGNPLALYLQSGRVTVAPVLRGDMLEDGEVTVGDLTLLARYITHLNRFTARQKAAADITGDGMIDIRDVVQLAQELAGWKLQDSLTLLADADPMTVTVDTVERDGANVVEIPVRVSGNAGIAGFNFEVAYDRDALEVLAVIPGTDYTENFCTNLGEMGSEGLFATWYQTDNHVGDGILFTLRVRVLDSSGDLSVSIVGLENSFCNAEKANVSATYVAGGIQKPVIDLDGDGRATVADVLIALRALLDGETVEADVNRDGKFSLADIILLLKLCANGR